MLIITPIHLWFLSLMLSFQDLLATHAQVFQVFLVPTAYIFRQTKYQKTFSERLLRAGSISHFSSFRYVPTPKGVFAKPRDHHQQPFRAFLATMLGLLSSFRLGFTDHLVVRGKLAGHTVLTHHFCFQIPLSVRH